MKPSEFSAVQVSSVLPELQWDQPESAWLFELPVEFGGSLEKAATPVQDSLMAFDIKTGAQAAQKAFEERTSIKGRRIRIKAAQGKKPDIKSLLQSFKNQDLNRSVQIESKDVTPTRLSLANEGKPLKLKLRPRGTSAGRGSKSPDPRSQEPEKRKIKIRVGRASVIVKNNN